MTAPTLDQLRARIAAVGAAPEHARRVLAVPEALADLLPMRGLPCGAVVTVSGAGSLLAGVLAAVTANGGYAAVVGRPRLGLLAIAEMGGDLQRLALVPNPGPDPAEIAAVLLDGMDLVVLDLAARTVPPARSRVLTARARSKGGALLVIDGPWDSAEIRLHATVDDVVLGRGRVHGVRLAVRCQGRAFAPRHSRMELRHTAGRTELTRETR